MMMMRRSMLNSRGHFSYFLRRFGSSRIMAKMIKEDDNDIRTCHDNDNDDDKYVDDDYDLTCPSRAFQGTVCAPLYKIFAQFFLKRKQFVHLFEKYIVCAPIHKIFSEFCLQKIVCSPSCCSSPSALLPSLVEILLVARNPAPSYLSNCCHYWSSAPSYVSNRLHHWTF